MRWLQEIQLVARLEVVAFPATLDALLLATIPYLAERGATSAFAALAASEFHHCPQHIVTLLVVLKCPKKGDGR
jgi:hypothetical protein